MYTIGGCIQQSDAGYEEQAILSDRDVPGTPKSTVLLLKGWD